MLEIMIVFKVIVWICGIIAILTGANDFLNGASAKGDFGDLGKHVNGQMLNFTIRFLGAIWMGFGALLILFASNLKQYEIALMVAFCFVILGGIGRIISIAQHGVAKGQEMTVYGILGIELVLVPALLLWLVFTDKAMLQ
jgi:hypothetical protein